MSAPTPSEAVIATAPPVDHGALIAAIRAALPPVAGPVPLHEPEFAGREWEYVKSCLDDGWVSSVGGFADRFEAELAQLCGVRYAVATVNGTAALHAALVALEIGPGDEVLTPALTFVATANAVSYTGATPHFIDSDGSRLGVDPARLRAHLASIAEPAGGDATGPRFRNRHTGRLLKAVVSMHVFGHPVDADAIDEVAAEYGLIHVEDAAEALGSRYKDRPAGSLGRVSALSFNGNKIVTTGGGGAVLTDDEAIARRVRHVCTTAKRSHPWEYAHDRAAYNYRLPNLNAALGCAQLEQLPGFLARKRALAAAYRAALDALPGISFVSEPADSFSNYWLNAILLPPAATMAERDATLAALHAAGLLCRPAWQLMPTLPMYRDCPSAELGCARALAVRIINLPSSARLGSA